jgi:dienelactone hydrolase
MSIQVYPGAYHDFDARGQSPHSFMGHTMAYDARATADARARVTAFLHPYMQ